MRNLHADVVVIGLGEAGRAARDHHEAAGRMVIGLDARDGREVAGIYPGPLVVARDGREIIGVHCEEVVVATGSSEIQPVAPGTGLIGLYTVDAVDALHQAGVELGPIVAIGRPPTTAPHRLAEGELVRFEGEDTVTAVVTRTDGGEQKWECAAVSLGLGRYPRDILLRMGSGMPVTAAGSVGDPTELPPPPVAGVVCPCSGVSVEQLDSVVGRGFEELELVKRSTLAGTGTCQGQTCLPHVRSYLTERVGATPAPFTARPLARQLTISETIANYRLPGFFKTSLDSIHRQSGGVMDRFGPWYRPWHYGDPLAEYWAVRSGVSIMDVSTLGKMIVTGPDVNEFLERLYPTPVATIEPGRCKYVLMLNEKGAVFDDGMVCREDDHRFTLTFTSSGVSFAEMWMRDWAEAWGMDVRILNRTASLGAINVTGPRSQDLLESMGLDLLPPFLGHRRMEVAGVPAHVFRLSFTGEASYEIHHPIDRSPRLWQALLEAGDPFGVIPHGLEALLTLRLEKGHIIVGQDTEADSTARRLDHEWAVKPEKGDFLGRQAVLRTDAIELDRQLVGLTMEGPAPDEGTVLHDDEGLSGYVTSARYSPTLERTVMLGWVRLVDGEVPDTLRADDRLVHRAGTPFYDPEGSRARA